MKNLLISVKITTFACAMTALIGLSGCAPWATGGCGSEVLVVNPCSSCCSTPAYSCSRVYSCAYTRCGSCGGGCNANYVAGNPYPNYPAVY